MATRQETRARREALKDHLRSISREPGVDARPAPTVRELAAQWNLSVNLVLEAQRELVAEGVLQKTPRVGTFVGQPASADNLFLLVFSERVHEDANNLPPRTGFEERLAVLGGSALTLRYDVAAGLMKAGALGTVAGVFDYSAATATGSLWTDATHGLALPRVRFGSRREAAPQTDFVAFEDERGGAQATRHLLARKHKNIAFLAFHAGAEGSSLTRWSVDRMRGWQTAMEEAGQASQGSCFQPRKEHLFFETELIEREMAVPIGALLAHEEITAVVTANDTLANCLLDALTTQQRPIDSWPSIVSFDGGQNLNSPILTSLRMPWDELGRQAAELLWSRSHNLSREGSQHRQVAMRLIPRLSCHNSRGYAAAHLGLIEQGI